MAVIGITETRKLAYIVKDSKQQSKLKLDMKELESKFYYILGFITHSKGVDFKQAYIYYKKAVDLCPHIYQAQFGLGQIYVKNRDFKNAISCFETIVNNKTETESSDCFRVSLNCPKIRSNWTELTKSRLWLTAIRGSERSRRVPTTMNLASNTSLRTWNCI